MNSKLYVGNLPYSSDESSLRELFEQSGTVTSVNVITDRDSGRSKGFCFIEMESEGQAEEAIDKFNGHEIDGRALKVSKAKPKESRGGSGGGRGRW